MVNDKAPNPIYALSNNDGPGTKITHVILSGPNYEEWAKGFRVSLGAKRKLGFINGTFLKPAVDSIDLEDWLTVNYMIVAWIFNTIDPSIRSTISYRDTAHELWEDIQQRFSLGNSVKIYQLKSDISNCKQKSGESIMDYYGRLKKLWDDLNDYDALPSCSCTGCKCGLNATLRQRRECDQVREFLMGLEPYYATVRSNILGIEPLPSPHTVYSRLVQEEEVRSFTQRRAEVAAPLAFAVQGQASQSQGSHIARAPIRCTHCGKRWHTEERCWDKHGYPDGRDRKGPGTGRGKEKMGSSQNTQSATAHAVFGNQVPAVTNHVRLNGKGINTWIIDSGASVHVCCDETLFDSCRSIPPINVGLPNGVHISATTVGSVQLNDALMLSDVLFVPSFHCNLISVSQLLSSLPLNLQFTNSECVIQDRTQRTKIGVGKLKDGIYYLMGGPVCVNVVTGNESVALWHKRLGHPSLQAMEHLPQVSQHKNNLNFQACDICHRAKQTRNIFPSSDNKADDLFDLIHCDVWGAYRENRACNSRYFLSIVDDFSRCLWVYLMKTKDEVPGLLLNFFALVERQFGKRVKIMRSDNGTEFNGLAAYFREHGILHQTSNVKTPQQNARVERKHRHVLNVARALRFQGHLPIDFWGECVLAAAHLINRTPSRVLQGKTPFELLFGRTPDLSSLRVFGCLCYAKNLHCRDKFESRSRRCIFLGYPFGKKGWQLFDLETGDYFQSRDVQFYEDTFPLADPQELKQLHSLYPPEFNQVNDTDELCDIGDVAPDYTCQNDLPSSDFSTVQQEVEQTSSDDTQCTGSAVSLDMGISEVAHSGTIETGENFGTTETEENLVRSDGDEVMLGDIELGRGKREKIPNTRYREFVCWAKGSTTNTITVPPEASPTSVRASGTPYSITHYVNCNNFSDGHRRFLAAISTNAEPTSFKAAMLDPRWKKAMAEEIAALEANETWTVQELPPGKTPIGCMWVFRIKRKSDGTVERYKARLVVLGNHQVEGINFGETFAPTVKMVTVRTFLTVAAIKNWELHQMDVHNAFLHGDLADEVYMRPPPGFSNGLSGKVCKLRKSLYGLRQAPRCWYAKLATALRTYGFSPSTSDHSLFLFRKREVVINILVYVDDLVIAGNDSDAINDFKVYLSSCFHMKDLGKLKYFLGIEVARSSRGIFICQRKYALDILTETGLLGSKPASVPMDENHQLALATDTSIPDPERYRRLVGRLIYLTITRPELCYSVHILSQFMKNPTRSQWEAAMRVVRYLKSSPGQGILLRADSNLVLSAYSDADWASCPISRRSLTAYFVFLGGSPISWKTKKQATVSRSSAEAEYRAIASATCEIIWLKGLLRSLGIAHPAPVSLSCDSQAALHIANNPVFHERTKHIEIDCHFVRDEILRGTIAPSYVHTTSQLADILTKALGRGTFQSLLAKLGITNLHAPT